MLDRPARVTRLAIFLHAREMEERTTASSESMFPLASSYASPNFTPIKPPAKEATCILYMCNVRPQPAATASLRASDRKVHPIV
eukprot:scaffold225982_cov27-Prasinocladus_malaysianus.AAC.1